MAAGATQPHEFTSASVCKHACVRSHPVDQNLSSLQCRLTFLESFRAPLHADFLPEATADIPALAIMPNNAGIVSYRILLHHLRAEAEKLSQVSAYVSLNTAIRIARFQASLCSKFMALNTIINDLYAAQHRLASSSSCVSWCMYCKIVRNVLMHDARIHLYHHPCAFLNIYLTVVIM